MILINIWSKFFRILKITFCDNFYYFFLFSVDYLFWFVEYRSFWRRKTDSSVLRRVPAGLRVSPTWFCFKNCYEQWFLFKKYFLRRFKLDWDVLSDWSRSPIGYSAISAGYSAGNWTGRIYFRYNLSVSYFRTISYRSSE